MKKFKKMMALAIAMVMMLSMSISVFATEVDPSAADSGKKTITINDETEGFTYEALQIFSGNVAEDGVTLSNIDWGTNINGAALLTAIQADDTFKTGDPAKNIFEGVTDAKGVAKALSTASDNSDIAKRFALLAGKNVTGTGTTLAWDGTNKNYSGEVDPGYYLVRNTAVPAVSEDDNTGAYTEFILKVVGDAEATPKRNDVTVDKKVGEKNDSTDTGATTVDDTYADYDIGDDVPFKLTATTAANVHAYKKYHVQFVDTQDGFKAPESFSVTVGTNEAVTLNADNNWTQTITDSTNGVKITVVATDVAANGFKIKVIFEDTVATDLQIGSTAYDGAKITVDYTSELDTSAQIGNDGNPNTVKLKFSNNPNSSDDSEEGETPEKTVVVFTYKMDVDKIVAKSDKSGYDAKTGAGFTLYKKYAEEVGGATNSAADLGRATTEFWYAVGEEVTGGTNFSFEGLDAGDYILVETTTPDGFNTMANLSFTIGATITESTTADNGYAITGLSGPSGFAASPNGGEFTFTRPKADGSGNENVTTKIDGTTDELVTGEIFGQIINEQGTALPSTGGIGTTMFYIIGAILVLGAGVVLVTRRRMSAN